MNDAAYVVEEHVAGDGYRWRYRRYDAGDNPRGLIVFVHGIQSHAGWYDNSCRQLQQAGYTVYFLDRRGSGMNQEARGDAPSFRRLLDDLAEFLMWLPRSAARGHSTIRLPVFLGAISWGGKLAAALERRHPGLVNGLMLLCPGFVPRIKVPLRRRLWIFLTRWFRPSKPFPIPLSDPELFTATPRWLDFLHHDPLRLHQATARFLLESARLDGYLMFVPKYVHVPVLLQLAENDRIIHNGRTRSFVERFAARDKTIVEYAGAQHTLEFEPEPHPYVGDMVRWLEAHLDDPDGPAPATPAT